MGGGEIPPAELTRPRDPAQAGVVALRPPRRRRRQQLSFDGRVPLLEHCNLVGALAPFELSLCGFALGVGVEECSDFGAEVVDVDGVGHRVSVTEPADRSDTEA
ncbi:MAG TPA: hypothetical protein VGP51_07895 [Nocardioidaceae bacterium]|nr:hypothetical protein [Nocardioidaceae bacterium]